MVALYTLLVRPILEYRSTVWMLYQKTYIDAIEAIQKKDFFVIFRQTGTNLDAPYILIMKTTGRGLPLL